GTGVLRLIPVNDNSINLIQMKPFDRSCSARAEADKLGVTSSLVVNNWTVNWVVVTDIHYLVTTRRINDSGLTRSSGRQGTSGGGKRTGEQEGDDRTTANANG